MEPPDAGVRGGGMKMLLTKSEAAEALGTGVDFIRSLVESGEVGFVAVGEDERVPREELDRWWRARVRHKAWPSEGDPTEVQTPGFSISAPVGTDTGSRSTRRTKEQRRPWNEKSEREPKRAKRNNVERLPSQTPSGATGRSTDDS